MSYDPTKFAFLDFESYGIEPRPKYPPRPIGLAHWLPPHPPGYLAFDHPSDNTNSRAEVVTFLKRALRERTSVWHNAGFDLDVAETQLGVAWPAAWHDTLLLAFLHDPLDPGLHLKELAIRHLQEPATERDELKEWILKHVKEATAKTWGAYIYRGPVPLVGKYAIGDVRRTRRLFEFYRPVRDDKRLAGAYERELKVTRTLVKMERRGIPVALARLEKDEKKYGRAQAALEGALMTRLKVPKAKRETFKWSGSAFPEQLLRAKVVTGLPKTKKGNYSVSMDVAAPFFKDPKLAKDLEVRAQLQTCLQTFMRPWIAMARETDGTCYLRFNQVRNPEGFGARTGRLSSSPNWQNLIRGDKDPRVPKLRDYVIPGRYAAFAVRDYSQQELRILAHYEEGPFLESYLINPTQDAHNAIKGLIYDITGITLERRAIKDLNFGLIYGMGIKKLARKMEVAFAEAKKAYRAHEQALPGIPALKEDLEARAAAKEPIYTWGGRRYYCEPPKYVEEDQRWWTFEYKLLNVLIQGSAADCIKEAMVNYDALGDLALENPMLLQVHDELANGVKRFKDLKRVHVAMRDAMADVKFAVPMLSEGKVGKVSWQQLEKVSW